MAFTKNIAGKKIIKLVVMVYKTTRNFPSQEKFRLVDQICRSASSIPANIVEGNARGHVKEYLQFLYQARGSLEETKYHLILAKDLNYLADKKYAEFLEQTEKVGKLINGLVKYLKSKISNQRSNI